MLKKMKQRNKKEIVKSNESNRLKEVIAILVRHEIIKGITPERVRSMIEDLGPTFVKLGQIMAMRSDMLPAPYCRELEKLHSEVKPMDFQEVSKVIEESLGSGLGKVFSFFDKEPLGSASIAQVHKAKLYNGEWVVVKVQRSGIREIMARDIKLLKKATMILKITNTVDGVIDFHTVLDEIWAITQEELDFLMEASHLEAFYENNLDVNYATCPKVYRHLTSSKVIVMEYIDGIPINQVDKLLEYGYDLTEIGTKLAENYSKQVLEDGLFHADPHPGNIMVRDGEIVWLDLGMMGKLTNHAKKLLMKFTECVVKADVNGIKEVVLSIGIRKKTINHSKLYTEIDDILSQYGALDFGDVNVSKFLEEVMQVAKNHSIQMPSSYSMLGRGLGSLESVLEIVSPDINYLEIAANHLSLSILEGFDWRKFLQNTAVNVNGSWEKLTEMPMLISSILSMFLKGQSKIGMELQSTKDFEKLATKLVNNLVLGIITASLLIGSSLIATTDMKPQILDIPLLGALGYSAAAILAIWLFVDLRKSMKK